MRKCLSKYYICFLKKKSKNNNNKSMDKKI